MVKSVDDLRVNIIALFHSCGHFVTLEATVNN